MRRQEGRDVDKILTKDILFIANFLISYLIEYLQYIRFLSMFLH